MIGRTVVITHCWGQRVVNGEFVDYQEDLFGDYDSDKATTTLRRRTGDQTITITRTEQDSEYYSIPIQLFVKTAIDYNKTKEKR